MNKKRYVVLALIVAVVALVYLLFKSDSFQTKQVKQESSSPLQNQRETAFGDCSGEVTPAATEGPYYKVNTPQRNNLRDEQTVGERLTVTGYVFDQNCQPISGAWLDFWQADGEGVYDNVGYNLRGHQFSDSEGKYTLETVMPGEYPGRTPHVHVKVKAFENSPVLTNQLYFPDVAGNEKDAIFNEATIVEMTETENGKVATYDFVLK